MFKTVVFDLDGTLLDTLQDLASAGNYTLSALGLPPHPKQSYCRMVGNGIPALIRRMLPENQRGEATRETAHTIFQNYYAKHMLDSTAPYPGILSVLQDLKDSGVSLGILSNKADIFLPEIVSRYFPGIFHAFMGKREDFPAKPDASSLYYLLEQLSAQPDTTLYCGDSDVDMLTAGNAGVKSCGVLWGFRDAAELSAAGADYLAEQPEDLLPIIYSP